MTEQTHRKGLLQHCAEASSRGTVWSTLGIVFFVMDPITVYSVTRWRGSMHPQNVTMGGEMRQVLLFSMLAWIVFYVAVLERRMRLEWARRAADVELGATGASTGVIAEVRGR